MSIFLKSVLAFISMFALKLLVTFDAGLLSVVCVWSDCEVASYTEDTSQVVLREIVVLVAAV